QAPAYLWVDRLETPHGPLFHGIYINAILTTDKIAFPKDFEQVTRFPSLPPHGFVAGERVAILTSAEDWKKRADDSLDREGLRLSVEEIVPVAAKEIAFYVIKGYLEDVRNAQSQ